MPLALESIHAVCFDVDGTLSDTDDQFADRLAGWLRPIRFIFPGQDYQRIARRLVMWAEAPGNALMGIADTLGLDREIDALVEWLNRHRGRSQRDFLLVPGVKEMLTRLHAHYPLAVVSARDATSTSMFLDQFGLTGLFKVIVTSQTVEHTKPYPDPILYAAGKLGVAPHGCLMVGDTTVDIRAGRAAGAQTLGVLCGFGEEAELRRLGADEILQSTAGLADVLLK